MREKMKAFAKKVAKDRAKSEKKYKAVVACMQ